MPIFIDEVVIRGEIVPAGGAAPGTEAGAGSADAPGVDRQELVAEITQAVIDHLERALERVGER